ncbi:hypothetical protein MKW98_017937, partial [Papaver atlanticum]
FPAAVGFGLWSSSLVITLLRVWFQLTSMFASTLIRISAFSASVLRMIVLSSPFL